MIFAYPSLREILHIKRVLAHFSQHSGLTINPSKSLLYGLNCSQAQLEFFSGILGCPIGHFLFSYLGIPIGIKRRHSSFWDPVIGKFKKKLAGWKGRCLSFGGRLVLVNAVLSSLPLHYMAFYKTPIKVLKKLESLRRNFLWGGDCCKKSCALSNGRPFVNQKNWEVSVLLLFG
ncbi:uncharacterized protein [Rutidosis leptorrhynchoides]|uniref:uncharacterized protein n=1 Tax=Rutidosis leptorrhynchoides TaxID=125765 RepID=UPI003A9A1076